MPKYKLAPKFEGKDVSLDLGRKILKPKAGVLYEDPKLARYVALGMMVKVDEKAPAKAPKAKPAPAPEPPPEAEVTTYTESELAKQNKAALADLGAKMGLELDMSMTKADMIEAILEEQG